MLRAFLAFSIAFSSVFFIQNYSGVYVTKEAEAKVCGIGEFIEYTTTTQGVCKKSTEINKENVDDTIKHSVGSMTKAIINSVSAVLFGVSIIYIIYAGFRMVTSGGRPQAVEEAKEQILNAGLAIIIISSVYTIYRLISGLFI